MFVIFLNQYLNVLENEEVVLKTATQDFVVVEAAPEVDIYIIGLMISIQRKIY